MPKTKNDQYNVIVASKTGLTINSWTNGSLNGHSAKVLTVPCSACTKGLKIIYGRKYSVQSRLDEVAVYTSTETSGDGWPGQLKTVIIPDIDGTEDFTLGFKYRQGDTIQRYPTEVSYRYWNNTTQRYETRPIAASYDEMRRLLSMVATDNKGVNYEYDGLGRPVKMTYGTTASKLDVEAVYDCCGLKLVRDEDSKETYLGYDAAHRLQKICTSAQGTCDPSQSNFPNAPAIVDAVRDALGNIISDTTYPNNDSAKSESMAYTSDAMGRPTGITYPEGIIGEEKCGYDAVGNVLWVKDGNGKYTVFKYDALYRLTNVYYNYNPANGLTPPNYTGLTASITYAYEGNSNLVSEATDVYGTNYYYYDVLGRLKRYTPELQSRSNYIVDYSYNNLGQKTQILIGVPTSSDYANCALTDIRYQVQYDYYANGWLKRVRSGATTLQSYKYDQVGSLLEVQYGNGTKASLAYSSGARDDLSSISYSKGSTNLATFGYTSRTNTGLPLVTTDANGGMTYTYDESCRLKAATPADGPVAEQPVGGAYVCDWLGNRTNPDAGINQMEYNKADQLVSWRGMYTYSYYPDGSLHEVRDVQGAITSHYDYVVSGLMSTAHYQGKFISNTWDANGNRARISVNGDSYDYVYDPTADIPAVLEEATSTGLVQYFRAPNGALIARLEGNPALPSSWRYYHYDEMGSTRLLTDGTGNVTDTYNYDPYGNITSRTGSTKQPYQWGGCYGYYTNYQDPEFKLIQMGYRFYDPEIGRFTQLDPIGAGINWYAYCDGNPLGGVDPWGLDFYDQLGRIIGPGRKGDAMDRFIEGGSNFFAGWGDALTLNGTGWVRDKIGANDVVDEGSGWYRAGEWTGVAHSVAFGVGGGIKAAGAKGAGREFSHFIPKRMGGPRSIFNGNYVKPWRHYKHDPFRYPRGWRNWGAKWPAPIAQLDRIPNLYKVTSLGLVYGLIGRAVGGDDNPCSQ